MPRKKRNLEKVEAIDRSTITQPPVLMTDADLKLWYGLLEEVLAERKAKRQSDQATTALANDISKSEGRKEFDSMIARIADRLRDAPPFPVPPLVLQHRGVQIDPVKPIANDIEQEMPLAELLRDLMRKANRN